MSLLLSNFPPVRTKFASYTDTFKKLLKESDKVSLATGYISTDSAVDLKNIIEANGGPYLNLCVGMHYFDGLTPVQNEALRDLDKFLQQAELGQVYMVTTFPFHGKVVSFSREEQLLGSIVGSSNLSNIIDGQRQYEVDYFIENGNEREDLKRFIYELIFKSATPLSELVVPINIPENDLLFDQIGVIKVSPDELEKVKNQRTDISFDIPLKGDDAQRSGLNASFGEGRKNQQGFVLPRPWYEVELIVGKDITSRRHYPQADARGSNGSFCVVTDDGWQFQCKVSGQNSKNLRSEDDLKVLGKWLKGRLENSGLLRPGERVTDKVLADYGRSSITMTKLADKNMWLMDFGVKK